MRAAQRIGPREDRGRLRAVFLAVVVASCREPGVARRSEFRVLPNLGSRLLVLAPHPDDEVLGAGGVVEAVLRSGGDVAVVVATDGEAGSHKAVNGGRLAEQRRAETRHALAQLGVASDAVTFLGYRDGTLASAWSEGWTAAKREDGEASASSVVADLRAALRATAPTSIALPMPMDGHPDHQALNRFTLLALLGEHPKGRTAELLGYLIHGSRRWHTEPFGADTTEPAPEGCPRLLFPWAELQLDRAAALRKATLIAGYRTQVGHSQRLFRYAARDEQFALGQVVRGPRPMSERHPGVHWTPGGIVIRVPRAACVIATARDERLRLRFFRAGNIEERVVRVDGSHVDVRGGAPGHALGAADDVAVTETAASVRLVLSAATFHDVSGVGLEVLPRERDAGSPAWLLFWSLVDAGRGAAEQHSS